MAKSQIASNGNHNGNGRRRGRHLRRYDYAAIFQWIIRYKIAHDGNSPSYGDLMRDCHISSRSVVNHILTTMERAHCIKRSGGAKRGIEIIGAQWTPPVKV